MSAAGFQRGDVVRIDIPYLDASQRVRRPALVVCDTAKMLDLIVAMISSRIRDPLPPTHYKIGSSHPDWHISGLRLTSVVRCDRLYTMEHDDVLDTLGTLSDATMKQIDDVLKTALGIVYPRICVLRAGSGNDFMNRPKQSVD